MKHIFFAFFIAIIAIPAIAAEPAHTLKPIEAKYVCMVNDTAFEKEQIAVKVDGKTYYGCCSMCEARLKKDTAIRSAVDPISGQQVDKAEAVIGTDPNGSVYYFESMANLEKYEVDVDTHHSKMMKGQKGMMMENHNGMMMKNHSGMMKSDMKEMHNKMMGSDKNLADLIKGTGILNSKMMDANKVNITHEPIPALKWPEMTMDFMVSEDVDLSSWNGGDQIVFSFKQENQTYVIEKIETMNDNQAPENHESDHTHHEEGE